MKTLLQVAKNKMCKRFIDSMSHATYMLEGQEKRLEITRKESVENEARLYLYFDDAFLGDISKVKIYDLEGDIVISSDRVYSKKTNNGLYIAFKYNFEEVEVV